MECSIKRFPLGQYSQTVAQAALEVREQLPDPADIASVTVRTLQTAVNIMAGDPEKWRPSNRETADHSMPYTAAVALMYGTVEQRHFGDEYLNNPQLMGLTSRVKVEVSEEANRRAPEAMLCDLEVVTGSGQTFSSQVAYHKGHYRNPLSDDEVGEKFLGLAEGVLPASRANGLLAHLWELDKVTDIPSLLRWARAS